MKLIGDKSLLAFEILPNDCDAPRIAHIRIWANNRHLNYEDSHPYLPSFIWSVKGDLGRDFSLNRFQDYFDRLSPGETLDFIDSTADVEDENIEDEEDDIPPSDEIISPNEILDFIDNTGDIEDKIYPYHMFMDWAETTDNFSSLLFRHDGNLYLSYSFWREHHRPQEEINKWFFIQIEEDYLVSILKELVQHFKEYA